MANKNLINRVSQKQEDGTLGNANNIGVDFSNVVDSRVDQGQYSLQQFFDSYMAFMKNTSFIYSGPNTPTNEHIALWFDTNPSTTIATEE